MDNVIPYEDRVLEDEGEVAISIGPRYLISTQDSSWCQCAVGDWYHAVFFRSESVPGGQLSNFSPNPESMLNGYQTYPLGV